MAQMHFYVPDDFAQEIRRGAKAARMPVSRYLVRGNARADKKPGNGL